MTKGSAVTAGSELPGLAGQQEPRPRRGRGPLRALGRYAPLWWTGPSLLLIAVIIVYPAIEMVRTSVEKVNSIGLTEGSAGLANYRHLFAESALGHVAVNTVLWVLLVVAVTILVSLALAQFLNKRFPGRRVVRWALIVPWAASLVMTSTVWRYIFEGSYGMLNRVLLDLGIIHTPVEWYKNNATAFWSLIIVGIIVSIPFSTYVLLAGLQAIPGELYDAARVDGGGPWQIYSKVTFPLLKPALLVSVVLNTIYVFNSFPIIWVITGKLPGDNTDTTITFMYKIAFTYRLDVGEAAALAVLNVFFLIVIVSLYMRRVRWTRTGESALAAGSARQRLLAKPREAAASRLAALARAISAALTPMARTAAAAAGVARSAWRPSRRVAMPTVGLIVAAFFLAPYAVMLTSSLKSNHDLFRSPALYLPSNWEWGNFASVWSKIPLAAYLVNSLVIAAVATAIVLLVSLPAAYFTARHNFRGRQAFLYTVLITQMFAPVALVVGIYREVDIADNLLRNGGAPFGAINSYWAIILVNAGFNLAFSIWIMNGYLASIPKEIEDAAMVDGAGRLRTMVRVVLPLAKPGIVTAVIFTFIQVWNEFVVAETIFNDPTTNRETLTVGINAFVGLYQTQYQYLFVVSIIGIVPVVILFAAIERYLVSGLTAGSIR